MGDGDGRYYVPIFFFYIFKTMKVDQKKKDDENKR